MNFKTALISGVGGQDGSYLAEHLLSLGYTVSGILRNSQTNKNNNIKQIKEHMKIYEGDILDNDFLKTINYSLYDEFYHLAAQSHVGLSFTMPNQTWNTNYNATLNLLDKYFTAKPNGKFYFAATSELFGRRPAPQNENTPFDPISPYSKSKYEALQACRVFRNNGKFVSAGILYNHESPRRGDKFVTQKIIQAIKKYKEDKNNNTLILGNLDAKRDWGYAKNYCQAMHLMLQHNNPDEFIIATNKTYSIKDFILKALKKANIEKYKIVESVKELNLDFREHANTLESIKDKDTFYILQSKEFYRPNEVDVLQGDYSKARDILGWSPTTSLDELIKIMLDG